jgi:hypothetical protein
MYLNGLMQWFSTASVQVNFSRRAAESKNIEESMRKHTLKHHFVPFFTLRRDAKHFFKISVPLAQKG